MCERSQRYRVDRTLSPRTLTYWWARSQKLAREMETEDAGLPGAIIFLPVRIRIFRVPSALPMIDHHGSK